MGEAGVKSLEQRQREKYVRRAAIPSRFHGRTLRDLKVPTEVLVPCLAFVERVAAGAEPVGKGLLLHGRPGRGKTTIAVCALMDTLATAPREALGKAPESDAMRPGYYSTYAEMIFEHKNSWGRTEDSSASEDLLKSLYGRQVNDWWNTRVLVLDDVGKEHSGQSGFTVNTLHDLLRSRYDKGLPTVVTTNLDPSDWGMSYGEAMASFIHEAFTIVAVGGSDRRRT